MAGAVGGCGVWYPAIRVQAPKVGRYVGLLGCGEASRGPRWRCRCDEQEDAPRVKRGGDLYPARPDWCPETKEPRAPQGGLIAVSVTSFSQPEGVPLCSRTSCSFAGNPRGSPDLLAYPVPKAYMHIVGTGVPRCLGVARSASSPKAAQALGCSLTNGLWTTFGLVTCMARAASAPGLWTVGFLLLCGACVWNRSGFRRNPANRGWGLGYVSLGTGAWLGFVVCAVGRGFWLGPPRFWLGFWCVCGCVRAPPVPCHS